MSRELLGTSPVLTPISERTVLARPRGARNPFTHLTSISVLPERQLSSLP